jgi:hypothetical protein
LRFVGFECDELRVVADFPVRKGCGLNKALMREALSSTNRRRLEVQVKLLNPFYYATRVKEVFPLKWANFPSVCVFKASKSFTNTSSQSHQVQSSHQLNLHSKLSFPNWDS